MPQTEILFRVDGVRGQSVSPLLLFSGYSVKHFDHLPVDHVLALFFVFTVLLRAMVQLP